MAQLWGGRFTKETDKLVYNFNASISFDQKFYRQDIRGSKAHVAMLAKQGILTEEEKEQITEGLDGILADVEAGKLEITAEYEDIHSFVEANLIDRIGDAGKKLHTGRSRNDQVALDMKLYVRDEIDETDKELKDLLLALQKIMEENVHTYMPGFTHLQKAQPVTLAHHVGAYFEMFRRDRDRLFDIRKRMNTCPLGAGALAGTTYPLDRAYTAELLGFDAPTRNSMDSVSDRDYVIELLSAFSTIMMHLSRFSEEIILWNSNEYRNLLIWSGKTAVDHKNFAIAFYRTLSLTLVNRHMPVDDVTFFRIQFKFTEQIIYNILIFQKMIVGIFSFFMCFLIFNKITFKGGHLVFSEQR